MRTKVLASVVAIVASVVGLAACSSSSKSTGGTTGGGSTAAKTGSIKIGVLTDLTGAASSGFVTTEKGIKAYVDALNKTGGINGQQITYVMGDTASSAAGALTAAQKMVQSDKVFAIVEVSSFFFGAEPFLLKSGIPVVGGGFDGTVWNDEKNTNMFNVAGTTNYLDVPLAEGQFFKSQGVTKCAAIGYSTSQSSSASVKAFNKSCELAGMKSVFSTGVAFGSTDVGAIAIKIKESGADGLFYSTVPNTAFALNAALAQLGVKLKLATLPTGYGGDLLSSAPAVEAAQGYFFSTVGLAAEANTPATQKRATDFTAVGVSGPPTFAEQEAYLAMTGFVAGLKKTGASPSREAYMTAMSGIKDFDGDGLLAPNKIDFRNYRPDHYCFFYVKLQGKAFQNVTGSPSCAGTVPLAG
jgi:branched-chain amino acid transport system substrate-binding protein